MVKAWVFVITFSFALAGIYLTYSNFKIPLKNEDYTKWEQGTTEWSKVGRKGQAEDIFSSIPDNPDRFDVNGSDVIVYLHIQKAGGWACGLHADWTELRECVPRKMDELDKVVKKRRFFYVTTLRDPVQRYISEWMHVRRGATWKNSLHQCKGHRCVIPKCFTGKTWEDATLEDFLSCKYNLANNRQTRMLADLRLVDCYRLWIDHDMEPVERNRLENILLRSAKKNLQKMAFFGLTEEQKKVQRMFEHTFSIRFKADFKQYNVTRISSFKPSPEEITRIKNRNHLDVELFDFAKKLFDQRYTEWAERRRYNAFDHGSQPLH